MTEEQQGGTEPQPRASASEANPAPEERVAAVAVADEPATTNPASDETGGTTETADVPSADAPEGAEAVQTEDGGDAAGAGDSRDAGEPQAGEGGSATDEPPTSIDATPHADATPDADDTVAADADDTVAADAAPQTAAAPSASDEVPTATNVLPEAPAPAVRAPRTDLGPEPTTMEELLAEQDSDIKSFKHGDVVEGTVVRIDKDEILVDIGAKSEGVVSNRELYGRHAEAQPQLTIGDTVLVYVLQPESQEGHVVLSLRRAGLERKWRSMQEQFEAGLIIEAPVIDHNKGGLIVDCGIRGFVPISQIVDFPRRPQNDQPRDAAQEIAEKLQPFVGRKLRLKILEVNRKANRLILSEKVALYEERREKRDELFSSLQVGQKVNGTVRSIAPFGVFIDLGGIDGLVHKSELSWNKVNNPEAGYKIGDEVEAEVIDINHERGRISLSIRRLQPDPWHSTVADFKVGDVIDGTVTKLVNFGAFVRVRDGLEGLIHISELSHQRVAHPGDVVHEGQNLKLKIISLDSERHRLGLSLKQAEEPPARPAPEPGAPRAERRPRQDRGYSMADAVQEPEGGIDNTLAAAFAQVREQFAASEEARVAAEGDTTVEGEPTAEPEVTGEAVAPADADTAAEPDGAAPATTEPETAETAEAETLTEAAERAETEPEDGVPPIVAAADAAVEPGVEVGESAATGDTETLATGAPLPDDSDTGETGAEAEPAPTDDASADAAEPIAEAGEEQPSA